MPANKYLIIVIVLVLLLLGGYILKVTKSKSATTAVPPTGNVVQVTLVAKKNNWRWEPENMKINAGDRIKMTVVNEDDYDHGLAIDGYGISQRMPALSTIAIEFIASRRGRFSFYCSVPCGKGIVDGKERGHFDMVGYIDVE